MQNICENVSRHLLAPKKPIQLLLKGKTFNAGINQNCGLPGISGYVAGGLIFMITTYDKP